MKEKEESEKAGLKLNIQKMKIMASSPITSWQRDGETMETVTDFIFLDSKITADGDCSQEIKRYLLLGRKVMTNLDNILKSRDYFANKDPFGQSYGFCRRRQWHPTPVLLPGKPHGRRSLVGYSPWGCKELDMTEHVPTTLPATELASSLYNHLITCFYTEL